MKLTQILKEMIDNPRELSIGDTIKLSDATADMFTIEKDPSIIVPGVRYSVKGDVIAPREGDYEEIRFDINLNEKGYYFDRFKTNWLKEFGDMEFKFYKELGRKYFMPVNFKFRPPIDLSGEYAGPPGSYTGD